MKNLPTPALWIPSVIDRGWRLVILAAVCLATIGCNSSDSGRYEISGSVTYQGKPVQHGTIMFEPDTSKGNSGSAGSAVIVDGEFNSAQAGTGFTGGPQIVSIQGFSGNDVDPEYAPYGTPIGRGKSYIKAFDFPEKGNIKQNFEMADVIDAK